MDTATATALARQIQVRHREPGHLRLELPALLLAAIPNLEAGLRRVTGVYRVLLEGNRLSIRFDPYTCSDGQVARALKAALLELPPLPGATAVPDASAQPDLPALLSQLGNQLLPILTTTGKAAIGLFQNLGQRLVLVPAAVPVTPGAEPCQSADPDKVTTNQALGQRLQGLVQGAMTERAAINFLNDILAFYLIKVHWDLITRRWLKEPLKFANAWLTVFYLVFLLVRYRKLASKP